MKIARRFLPFFVAAGMLASAPALAADPEVEARFKRGVELYNEADFRSAAVEFRRAYEKERNYKILYNIAQCEYQLTNYVGALDAFERYLADGGTHITAARRKEVEAEIPKIKGRIASVTIRSNVSGATVTVDEQTVGTTPLAAPVPMNPGSHRLVVRKDGFNETRKAIEVGGGDAPSIELALAEQARPSDNGARPPPAQEPTSGKSWTPAIVAWSVAGIGLAGGIVFGLTAQSKSDKLKDAKDSPTTSRSELDDLDASTSTFALLTDISFGVAIVGAGIATYFTIDAAKSSSARASTPKPTSATVRFAPTLGGMSCSGTF